MVANLNRHVVKIKELEDLLKNHVDTIELFKSQLKEMKIKTQNDNNIIDQLQVKIKFFEDKVVEAAENEECNRKKLEDAQNEILRNKVQYENSIKELEAKQIAALVNKEIEFRNNKNKFENLKDISNSKLEDMNDNSNNKPENMNNNLIKKLDESDEIEKKVRMMVIVSINCN